MYFFSNNNEHLFKIYEIEQAYLSIIGEDLDVAYKLFKKNDSPRGLWGRALVSILNGYVEIFPTYFQIRNFLEIDLDFLLKNKKIDYVEMLLGASNILIDTNQETYKYIARALFANEYYESAKEYLEKSKNILYNDPEMHFLLSKYYILVKDYLNANLSLDKCLKYVPDYYPAKKLQEEISLYLA